MSIFNLHSEVGVNDCRHHWHIEIPAGPTSKGVCQLCGVEREFRSSQEWVMKLRRDTERVKEYRG